MLMYVDLYGFIHLLPSWQIIRRGRSRALTVKVKKASGDSETGFFMSFIHSEGHEVTQGCRKMERR